MTVSIRLNYLNVLTDDLQGSKSSLVVTRRSM
jgi:hypothetical protein